MSPKVHKIVSDLMIRGVDIGFINNKIYDSNSLDKLKLIGYALSEKLEVISNGNAAYIVLSRKDLKDHNFKKGDTEGLVNYALSISNVNMAVLIIETKERIKFSFRSIGQFSVNEFAKKYFNGGGHKNASGGFSNDSIKKTEKKFISSIEEFLRLWEKKFYFF